MRAQDYDAIVEEFHSFPGADPTEHLINTFPQYESAVLSSIATQEMQKYVKVNYKKFSNPHRVASYYKRYTAAVERGEGPGILLDMANRSYFSPALLAKLVLERHIAVQDELEAAAASLPEPDVARNMASPPPPMEGDGAVSSSEDSPVDEVPTSELGAPAAVTGEKSFLCEGSEVELGSIMEDLEESCEVQQDDNSVACRGIEEALAGPELAHQDTSTASSPDDVSPPSERSEKMDTVSQGACREEEPGAATGDQARTAPKPLSTGGSQLVAVGSGEVSQTQKKKSAVATKSRINKLLRDTSLIADKVLSFEVHLCLINDDVYGPFADTIKHSIGHEYEELLKRKLRERNISFLTEEELRTLGCDKTPDTKLDVPIGVGGRVVNWIESKASFGDRENHKNYLSDQLWSYWNRFGPGLVIYWFGYIEELNHLQDRGILIRDTFPDDIVTMDPLALSSASLCGA